MSDVESPWPERERTQALLFGVGALLLLPAALALADLVEFAGAVVVGSTTIASALLLYGLLGWGGNRVAADAPRREESTDDEPGSEGPAADDPGSAESVEEDPGSAESVEEDPGSAESAS